MNKDTFHFENVFWRWMYKQLTDENSAIFQNQEVLKLRLFHLKVNHVNFRSVIMH